MTNMKVSILHLSKATKENYTKLKPVYKVATMELEPRSSKYRTGAVTTHTIQVIFSACGHT
jgi:hypothetical protein